MATFYSPASSYPQAAQHNPHSADGRWRWNGSGYTDTTGANEAMPYGTPIITDQGERYVWGNNAAPDGWLVTGGGGGYVAPYVAPSGGGGGDAFGQLAQLYALLAAKAGRSVIGIKPAEVVTLPTGTGVTTEDVTIQTDTELMADINALPAAPANTDLEPLFKQLVAKLNDQFNMAAARGGRSFAKLQYLQSLMGLLGGGGSNNALLMLALLGGDLGDLGDII